MVINLLAWLYLSFFLESFPIFWDLLGDVIFEIPRIFLITTVSALFINAFLFVWRESFNNNGDVFYKFFVFCCRAVSIFFILLFAQMKKFYYFLGRFEYKKTFDTFLGLIFLKIGNKNVIWRPLFRKWSYFGFFKTNRSKWWKNK